MVDASYRFRYYPTQEQESLLRRTIGCVRLIYNKALAARTQAWYEDQERVSYKQTSAMLTNWKKQEDLDFLTEVSSVPLQQGLRNLQAAFTNFFSGRAQYPNFKKKRHGGSAEFTKAAFKWKDGQVHLAKCAEPLPIRWSRQLPAGCVPSTITVKLDPSGRWSVSLRVNDTRDLRLKPIEKQIGIDLGITSLLTASDGEKVANPKNLQKLHKKLRLAQKSLDRKTDKKSKNYQEARLKVARTHAKIKDSRLDMTHKLTTQLIRENQTIVVEEMAVKNMVKKRCDPATTAVASGQTPRCRQAQAVRPRDDVSLRDMKSSAPLQEASRKRSDPATTPVASGQTPRRRQAQAVRPRVGVRRKGTRTKRGNADQERERRPREGMGTKRGNGHQERECAPRDHKLARAISHANWGELVRQLEYKADWYGRRLIKIDRYFPSASERGTALTKRCSNCGYVVGKLPLNIIREWDCPECGTHHDRDINAAINILRMGTRVGDRRKRCDPATTKVARECAPREGMLTKRGNAHQERERPPRRLRDSQCQRQSLMGETSFGGAGLSVE